MARGSTGSGSGGGGGAVSSVAGKTGVVSLVKGDVGLANVDNTADTAKPVSTAAQTALDAKAPLANPTFTGTVSGVSKAAVGLGNVDNTADASKPISAAQAAVNATLGSMAATSSPLRAVPITDNSYSLANLTPLTTTGTGRAPYTVAVDATDLRLVFANWFNQGSNGSPIESDTPNPNSITVSASVEVSGVKYRVPFTTGLTTAIAGGTFVQSEPIPIDVTAGQVIYVWTYVQPVVGWYPNRVSAFATGQGGFSTQRTDAAATTTSGSSTVTDTAILAADYGKPVTGAGVPAGSYVGTVTAATSFLLSSTSGSQTAVLATSAGTGVVIGGDLTGTNISAATAPEITTSSMYMPNQIIGRPLAPLSGPKSTPVALLVGDSLMAGSNDYSSGFTGRNVANPQLAGGGYTARALVGKIPTINTAVSGDRAQLFLANNGHYLRWSWASAGTTMLCNYGINDINNGRTLTQLQTDLVTIWSMGTRRGMRVIQHTITPYASSTDGWSTTTNQTISNSAKEAVRVSLNDWIRDGAPLTSAANLTPVAVGTAGALRAGTTGHPLYTYFEIADLTESARNSGSWRILPGRTVIDASIGNSSSNLQSATAAFTSADVGALVSVAGAGASGATLSAQIQSVANATTVILSQSSGAAVSGATATVGVASTRDGLHPSPQVAVLMSAGIDLTKIV